MRAANVRKTPKSDSPPEFDRGMKWSTHPVIRQAADKTKKSRLFFCCRSNLTTIQHWTRGTITKGAYSGKTGLTNRPPNALSPK